MVDILPCKIVSDLKKKIKEERKPDLDHVAVHRLVIWKVSKPNHH
jgi:hypothetical protein